jgi:glycine/D-amino acid oxidase-like deaminating enzyme
MSRCWKGLSRLRQCRPQHHDHPLQLPAAGNNPFYELSMKLWENLEQDFNFNAMVSQRGVLNLAHADAQRDAYARRGNAMRLHGVDAELLDREAVSQDAALPRFRQRPLSRSSAACCSGAAARCATTRWPGAMRAAPTARRRHHPELRGHRHPARGRPRRRRRDDARLHRLRQAGARGRRQLFRSVRMAGSSCRSRAMCCRPSSPRG